MKRSGFTVIELIIVVTIMGVLIVMGTLSMSDSQIKARDVDRRNDMESLALQLEAYYNTGSIVNETNGRYPSINEFIGNEESLMVGLKLSSISAPGFSESTLVAATTNSEGTDVIQPNPTMDIYIYQPISQDGSLCITNTQECRKFNLYYTNEFNGNINIIRSKNR